MTQVLFDNLRFRIELSHNKLKDGNWFYTTSDGRTHRSSRGKHEETAFGTTSCTMSLCFDNSTFYLSMITLVSTLPPSAQRLRRLHELVCPASRRLQGRRGFSSGDNPWGSCLDKHVALLRYQTTTAIASTCLQYYFILILDSIFKHSHWAAFILVN